VGAGAERRPSVGAGPPHRGCESAGRRCVRERSEQRSEASRERSDQAEAVPLEGTDWSIYRCPSL
jgi:hypothetical protein